MTMSDFSRSDLGGGFFVPVLVASHEYVCLPVSISNNVLSGKSDLSKNALWQTVSDGC